MHYQSGGAVAVAGMHTHYRSIMEDYYNQQNGKNPKGFAPVRPSRISPLLFRCFFAVFAAFFALFSLFCAVFAHFCAAFSPTFAPLSGRSTNCCVTGRSCSKGKRSTPIWRPAICTSGMVGCCIAVRRRPAQAAKRANYSGPWCVLRLSVK